LRILKVETTIAIKLQKLMNSIENQSQYKFPTNFMNHNTIHDSQFEILKMPLKIIGFVIILAFTKFNIISPKKK